MYSLYCIVILYSYNVMYSLLLKVFITEQSRYEYLWSHLILLDSKFHWQHLQIYS